MRKINTIVIHHSGNHDTKEKIKQLHIEEYGWDDIGCHYMISREGYILDGRPVHQIGAHVKGFNQDSIGIDFLGNFDIDKPTDSQSLAMLKFIKALMKKYNIPIENIKAHKDFPGVKKSCPGKNFNIQEFKEKLKQIL